MPFRIVRNDITKMNTEAIVNTAAESVTVGSGCDRAVYEAAGMDRLLKYRKENIGAAKEGEAFLTPGFGLPAEYIIHAVSPLYRDGKSGEEQKLRFCYRNSLKLALDKGISSVAFPLISSGSFGYPKEEAMRIAVDEISAFLLLHDMDICLTVFGDGAVRLAERITPDLKAYIDSHYVDEAIKKEYYAPSAHSKTTGRNRMSSLLSSVISGRTGDAENAKQSGPRPLGASVPYVGADKTGAYAPESDAYAPESDAYAPESGVYASESCACAPASGTYAPEFCADASEPYDVEELERKLKERMKHMSDTYSEYLMYLIREKNMENSEVYKRAIVDKKVFSKIKNNADYHPNKMTALCLCIGAKLNLDESRDLLSRAGYALSPCDKTDIIFSYFIENEIYDMIELDIQLEEHGLPCIIS